MVSPILGPPVAGASALADLQRLLADESGRRMVDEWLALPITRIVAKAVSEATQARSPRPGLLPHDFACAAGESLGMQRIAACLHDPELILDSVGMTALPERPTLPKPTYSAPSQPVPPPVVEGNDAVPQTNKGARRKST